MSLATILLSNDRNTLRGGILTKAATICFSAAEIGEAFFFGRRTRSSSGSNFGWYVTIVPSFVDVLSVNLTL